MPERKVDIINYKRKTLTSPMGIVLGIKVPAVSYCDNRKAKFYGNGRKNKYMKRFYRYQRKKLQKILKKIC